MKKNVIHKILLFSGYLFIVCFTLNGQFFEYRSEESAVISWNGTTCYDARRLAAGGVSLLASGPFSAVANPALPAITDHISLGGSLDFVYFQAFQYWGVNQGVLTAPSGLDDRHAGISGFSIIVPVKSIRLSLGWYLADILEFPDFDQDDQYWGYSGDFQGREDRYFMGIAFRIGSRFQLGTRLEYGIGQRSVDMVEHSFYEGGWYSFIEQAESHRSRSLNISVGMTVSLSSRWELGAVFDYPLYAEVDRSVERLFENNFPSPSIHDYQNSQDGHSIPAKIKLAASYLIWQKKYHHTTKKIILAAEAAMVFWSSYSYEFFGETLDRDLRNTPVAAFGIEYGCHNERFEYFLRAGYRMDTQPLKEPLTTVHAFSGGVGVARKRFSGNLGMAYYTGSAGNQSQSHFVFCATVGYAFKGDK
jgi:hypothetical protein